MALATPQRRRDAGPRAGALAGRPGQDPRRARGAGRRRSACPGRRCGSSATTSATSRAASRSAAWSCSRRAGRGPASTAGSGSGRSPGPNDFASHQEVLRRRFRPAGDGRGGERGGAPLGDARPRDHRRRQGPGQRGQGGPRRARACTTCRSPAWPRSARSCSCRAAPTRSSCRRRRRRSTSSSGSATRPTASRSPTTATCGPSARSGRRSTTCPASGRSGGGRCCGCSARSSASARRPVEQIAAVPGIGRARWPRTGSRRRCEA